MTYRRGPGWLEALFPFLALGIAVVLFIAAIFVLSYLLLWGAIIGFVLFIAAFVKNKFFSSSPSQVVRQGDVYDHDERP